MNSKSLQYDNIVSTKDVPSENSIVAVIISKVSAYLDHSEMRKAKRIFEIKRNAQIDPGQNIVESLPLDEKLRLGMYRYMD